MKIALLSMQHVMNYGSVLQAYSLQKMIEDITNEKVVYLNLPKKEFIDVNMPVQDSDDYTEARYIPNYFAYLIKKGVFKVVHKQFYRKVKNFQNKFFIAVDPYEDKTYDIVIQGSDEVFKSGQRIYLGLYGKLSCAKKLITYAAACGSAEISGIPYDAIDTVKSGMSRFSALSVRDTHTENYVKELSTAPVYRHLDPVLVGDLCKRNFEPVPMQKYMVVYAYGDRIRSAEEITSIKRYAKEKGLKTVAIGAPQYWCDTYLALDPFRVLDYFHYAECVITDTFHGSVFSIISKADFSVILRKTNSYKITALLADLGLENRVLDNMNSINHMYSKPIEWEIVDDILNKERHRSREYLSSQILGE